MNWHWPQYTIAFSLGISVLLASFLDGRPRTGKHNGAMTIIFLVAEAVILHCGGFW